MISLKKYYILLIIINWTGGSTIFSSESLFTASNGTMHIAVGNGVDNTLAYSYDGIIWKGLGKTIFSTQGNMVSYSSGKWVAVGENTNNNRIFYRWY